MIDNYSRWTAEGLIVGAIILVICFIIYCIVRNIDEKYFLPYQQSLRKYEKIFSPFAKNPTIIKYKQIHLPKTTLYEIYKNHPEKLSVENDRIIYTLIEEKDYYTILLSSRKDYNSFVKYFNEYTSAIKAKEKEIIEKENINKVLDDAYDVAR